jgi:hypothetical protein
MTYRVPEPERLVEITGHIDTVREPFLLTFPPHFRLYRLRDGALAVGSSEFIEVRFDGDTQSAVVIVDERQPRQSQSRYARRQNYG